jgi:hypothetical protein
MHNKSGPKSRDRPAVPVQNLGRFEAELATFHARLKGLEQLVAQIERRLPVTDGELVAELARATGGTSFTLRELEAHAEVDPILRETLERSPKPLGPALRRLAERPCGGFVLRRIKREFSGWRWFVTTSDGM